MFKSKALKDSNQVWSSTEREALAIRWAVKKLRKYLIGSPKFRIVSHHKPLMYMFGKTHGDLPPQVKKMVMDLKAFDYSLVYLPRKCGTLQTICLNVMLCEPGRVATKKWKYL